MVLGLIPDFSKEMPRPISVVAAAFVAFAVVAVCVMAFAVAAAE